MHSRAASPPRCAGAWPACSEYGRGLPSCSGVSSLRERLELTAAPVLIAGSLPFGGGDAMLAGRIVGGRKVGQERTERSPTCWAEGIYQSIVCGS